MKKRVEEIKRKRDYGNEYAKKAEPSREDVIAAVKEGRLETRNYRDDENELALEWSQHHPHGCVEVAKKYHAERMAFFWVNAVGRKNIRLRCVFTTFWRTEATDLWPQNTKLINGLIV